MRKVLIAGFGSVAHVLVKILPSDVYSVTGVKRSEGRSKFPNLKLLRADLRDKNSLSPIAREVFDYLIYCPSPDRKDKEYYQETYIKGLENLLQFDELLNSLQQFIFVSSTSVYGQKKGEWVDEESPTLPEIFSGRIILEAEKLLFAKLKKKLTILRFGGIYGKKKNRYIQKIKEGSFPSNQTLVKYTNRIHIQDCAGSIKHLMELAHPKNIYLGIDDHPAQQREVISWLIQKLDLSPSLLPSFNSEKHEENPTHTSNKRCKNQRIKQSGYTFLYPSYREGYLSVLNAQ